MSARGKGEGWAGRLLLKSLIVVGILVIAASGTAIFILKRSRAEVRELKAAGANVYVSNGGRTTPFILEPLEAIVGPLGKFDVIDGVECEGPAWSSRTAALVGRLSDLERLKIETANLDGAGWDELAGLKWVRHLNITGGCISDRDLSFCEGWTSLRGIYVRSECLDGEFLARLRCWNVLQSISLTGIRIDDDVTEHLTAGKELRVVVLMNSRVSDRGLESLAMLPKLESLNLRGSAVTDEGIRKFQVARPDVKLLYDSGAPQQSGGQKTSRGI